MAEIIKVEYLVIWQKGNQEDTRIETPIDVEYGQSRYFNAGRKYDLIMAHLSLKVKVDESQIVIIGIYKL